MKSSETMLLMVDMQEKLLELIPTKNQLIWNCRKIIEAANIFKIRIIYTEQNPARLGGTINQLKKMVSSTPYKKMSFSCLSCEDVAHKVKEEKANNIVMVGIETHICILQTALDILDYGYNLYLVVDSIGSRNSLDHEIAIRRLESKGAIICTAESILFDWCKTADIPEFKKINQLIKETN